MTTSATPPASSAAPAGAPPPVEPTHFVSVIGLKGIARDTEATCWMQIDHVQHSDPVHTEVVGDDSPGHRRSRLWLEAMLRKTPIPISTPTLSTAPRALADHLTYQHAAGLGRRRQDTIATWIAEKAKPAHKVGRLWKFQASEIDDWVRRGGAAADSEPSASG